MLHRGVPGIIPLLQWFVVAHDDTVFGNMRYPLETLEQSLLSVDEALLPQAQRYNLSIFVVLFRIRPYGYECRL